ncbi:MAG: hypothetical protein R2826_07270 [Thermoleophilia bacterium]
MRRPLRHPALLRARLRGGIFVLLAASAWLIGDPVASVPAVLGILIAVVAVLVARCNPHRFAHSFVVVDWLILGCVLALSGGAHSWLLWSVPVLIAGELAVSPRQEWPYMVAASLPCLVVLKIADPQLGGSQIGGVIIFATLLTGGVAAAQRLSLARTRRQRSPRLDPHTGLFAEERVMGIASAHLEAAAAQGNGVSLAYLRFDRPRRRLAHRRAGQADSFAKNLTELLRNEIGHDGQAFRIQPQAFIAVMPGRSRPEAYESMLAATRASADQLGAGEDVRMIVGVATAVSSSSLESLLDAARSDARVITLSAPPAEELALVAVSQ